MLRCRRSKSLGLSFSGFLFDGKLHVAWNGRKDGMDTTAQRLRKCGRARQESNNIKELYIFMMMKSAIEFVLIEFLCKVLGHKGHPSMKDSREERAPSTREVPVIWSIFSEVYLKLGILGCIWVYSLFLTILGQLTVVFLLKSGGTGGSSSVQINDLRVKA